jgi:hypothetical protein
MQYAIWRRTDRDTEDRRLCLSESRRNPTYRSGDAQRMRLCPRTKERNFRHRILMSGAVKPRRFRAPVCYFPWVRSHLCGIWNMSHVTFDSNWWTNKLSNIGIIRRDLCATARIIWDFISRHLMHMDLFGLFKQKVSLRSQCIVTCRDLFHWPPKDETPCLGDQPSDFPGSVRVPRRFVQHLSIDRSTIFACVTRK